MNYHDLQKLATPGPLRVAALTVGDVDIVAPDSRYVADLSGLQETNAKADANLLVHCANNFGKALEALKADRATLDALGDSLNSCLPDERIRELDKLIAELEEVK